MANWISISPADLNTTKLADLVEALRTIALAPGQADPAEEIISAVVLRLRAEIKGCQTNRLDADPAKIPGDLKDLAMRMILRQMQSRLRQKLNDDEKEEQRNDLRYLERIAQCKVPVAMPENPVEGAVQALAPSPSITPKNLQFRRQDGI